MLAALASGGKAWVVQPLGFPQGTAHPRPVVLVTPGDEDPTVLTGIRAAGSHTRLAALGLDAGPVVGRDGDLSIAIARVRQADVEALPLARQVALIERRQGANGGVQRRGAVDDGRPGANRRHALLAGDHGDAGHGLADGVVADLIAIGAKLAIRGD